MAKYEITQRCSVGAVGEVINVDGDLTPRQSVYLKPLNPKVEVVSNAELDALKAENEALKAELDALKTEKKLEVATPSDGDVTTQSTQKRPKGSRI